MGAFCGGGLSRDTMDRLSDRCLHFFPCLSDPARRSALCLRIALVMLHLIYVGVLFVFDKDLIHKTKQEPWYLLSHFTYWGISSYFMREFDHVGAKEQKTNNTVQTMSLRFGISS